MRGLEAGRVATMACCAALAAACVRDVPLPDGVADPDASFVAHAVHGGLVVDRGDGVTRIEARGIVERGPTFVVRDGDAALAGLWLRPTAFVVARAGLRDGTPTTAVVRPSWVDQAIRLDVDTDGGRIALGPFVRTGGGGGLSTLSRIGQTNLDTRGVYRATIVDARGAPRGWFEVRVPSPDTPRVYQGRLPPASVALGPAIAVALGSELDWIDLHTIDVYRGTGGRDRGFSGPAR